ncbi:hypothetical protein Taro_050465 [Colocasia esculenta]|uniref:Uncharacterized protein n=1 Tax=Colocasia esculenta TaxID=4460 RepID=A0A843XDY5_COLES|nr:hypothetical protein [Colocasia esculenta]
MAKVEGLRGKETTKPIFVKKGAASTAGIFRNNNNNNNKRPNAGETEDELYTQEDGNDQE